VWTIGGLGLLAGTSVAALRALRWRIRLLPALAVVVYLLAWAPAAGFTLTAQVSFVLMAPVTAAWLACRRGRPVATGVWLGLAAAMKPFLLVFLPYFWLRRKRDTLAAFGATLAAVFGVGLAVFGLDAYRQWAAQLPLVTWSAYYLNASFVGVLQRSVGRSSYALLAHAPDLVLPLAAMLSAVVALVTFRAVSHPRPEPLRTDGDWTALLLAALLISPLGWNYYLWIALWPAAALLAARAPWRHQTRHDLWLLPGLGGWLWWGRMTLWGQPHPLATLTLGSIYFWALLALWLWTVGAIRPRLAAPPSRPS
jgi:hypothetical protein